MDSGQVARLKILEEKLNQRIFLELLEPHNWSLANIERKSLGITEYLKFEISKFQKRISVGYLYGGSTRNEVYKHLDTFCDLILVQGSLESAKEYLRGVKAPVVSDDELCQKIQEWNAELSNGNIALSNTEKPICKRKKVSTYIQSENPIEKIWMRVKSFSNKEVCKALLIEKRNKQDLEIDDSILELKAAGLAYCIQNAYDYFDVAKTQKLNQKLTSLYYGAISFASAEMLGSLTGVNSLEEIEGYTKYGHGLFSLDLDRGKKFEDFVIGPLSNGFFKKWIDYLGEDSTKFTLKKPKEINKSDLDLEKHVKLIELFSRIPELDSTFSMITEHDPMWLKVHYDSGSDMFRGSKKDKSYVSITDPSCKVNLEDIDKLPYPFSEIQYSGSSDDGIKIKCLVNHQGSDYWFQALNLYRSTYTSSNLIRPILGNISQMKVINQMILYALSILVRYRPSIWREVESGELKKYNILIEEFVHIFCRNAPEKFLSDLLEEKVNVTTPGSLNAMI